MSSEAERRLIGRIGAYALHTQGKTNTGPARRAFMDKFEAGVDPDGMLTPEERARRAAAARKLYFTRLALRSVKARRAKTREGQEPVR